MDETNGKVGDGPADETGCAGRCRRSASRGIKTSHLVLLGAAIALGAALLVTGLSAADGRTGFFRDGGPAGVMPATWRPGWQDHGRGRLSELLCSEARDEMLEDRLAVVESFVDFTAAQRPAWDELTAAVRAGSARVGETCARLDALDAPTSAPGHLARVELVLSTGLDIVREVRPAFDQFYAALDADQKAALDRLASHRHRP